MVCLQSRLIYQFHRAKTVKFVGLLIIKFAKFELLTWHCSADISIWRRGGCGVRATLEGAEYKVVVEGECGRANGAGDEESSGGFWTNATGRG